MNNLPNPDVNNYFLEKGLGLAPSQLYKEDSLEIEKYSLIEGRMKEMEADANRRYFRNKGYS